MSSDWLYNSRSSPALEHHLEKISPVGIFPEGASPYGVQDMAGNVWEWTRNAWGRTKITYPDYGYPYDPNDGREALEALQISDLIVVRGGNFGMDQKYVRCAVRHGRHPSDFTSFGGFRVVWLLTNAEL